MTLEPVTKMVQRLTVTGQMATPSPLHRLPRIVPIKLEFSWTMGIAVAHGEPATASPRILGGRYRVTRLLKKGHGVETLLGTDPEDLAVVIKTASRDSLSVGAQMRLEHEAAALRQIRSPFVAPLIELGRHEDLLYLVMPLVKGLTLEQRL